MTSAELYQWMADPSLLNKSSLMELKQVVDDFPYFHTVRMLYLKNLAVINDVRLDKELKKMSVYIPDRRRLFMLINDKLFVDNVNKEQEQSGDGANKTDDVLDVVLSNTAPASVPPVLLTSDYVSWLESNTESIPNEDGTEARLKHQDLIDSFIENEGKILVQRSDDTSKAEDTEKRNEKLNSEQSEKASLDDSYFTETLARVYINQGRYEKALEIIRVLNLKYPEKNIYFADQIRYLEKIINIKT